MADVKISGLPAASTPLAGTEVLPIVQSGATKKVAVSDLTAGRGISASGLTVAGDSGLDGAVVINDSGADKDVRIEGDTDANLFFTDASTDCVGVGTNAPAVKIDVSVSNPTRGIVGRLFNAASSSQTGVQLTFTQTGIASWTVGQPAGASAFAVWATRTPSADGVEYMRVSGSGQLLVGATADGSAAFGAATSVAGRWDFGPATGYNVFYVINSSGTGVYITNGATTWTASSDERAKTDLKPIENGLNKVDQLRAVTGRFKNDAVGVSRAFLIAQDVLNVLPEAVDVPEEPERMMGVRYTEIIPLLVAAIKDLKAEVDALKAGQSA